MKQLKFNHGYIKAITEGRKTATFRVNDDKDIRLGDALEVVDKVEEDLPTTWQTIGLITVTYVEERPLRSLNEKDFNAAETFANNSEMIQVFKRFYGEHVNGDTIVSVINFNYEPYSQPRQYVEQSRTDGVVHRHVKIYADGGSRGNPGPSAAGFVILDNIDSVLHSDNKYLGVTTNNQAEYHAVILAMEWCLRHNVNEVDVFLDSMLVVNQLKGIFKVKNRDLWTLFETAKELSGRFSTFRVSHIPRELNKLADNEVNKALDAVKGSDIVQ